MGGMIANIIMLVVTSGLVGFKFALLTKITGSLYMAMGDHFVNNTIVNLLHVVSTTGADEMMVLRVAIAQSLSCVMVLVYYILAYCKKEK
jgi:membrane protease YdiL (CAAX protease family)